MGNADDVGRRHQVWSQSGVVRCGAGARVQVVLEDSPGGRHAYVELVDGGLSGGLGRGRRGSTTHQP